MKLNSRLFAAALVAAVPGIASAQTSGYYVGLGAGYNNTEDSELSGDGVAQEASFEDGWVGSGFFGYAYGNGLRTEIELNHRRNDLDNLTGDVTAWGLLANVYYDFRTGTAFTPYLGGGLGAARVNADGASPVGDSRADDTATGVAFQLIAGVSYQLNDRLSLFGDYRHFVAPDLSFQTDSGANFNADYVNNAVMVGLRWSFGAPARPAAPQPAAAPAAPAAPPPAPPAAARPAPQPAAVARNYLVFFDWDKADLTPEALSIVRTAATNSKSGNITRLRVTGHADRSGPDAYNMRLSQRRAQAVKAEMVRQGIPEREIAVVAKGETEPLVPTADGVREPQNRRVEIVFE